MISMRSRQIRTARRPRAVWAVCAAAVGLAAVQPAFAICRVTDFTDRPLSSLNEVQRVSFVSQMERTEFDQLKAKRPGDPNHYALIAGSASVTDARVASTSYVRLVSTSFVRSGIWVSCARREDRDADGSGIDGGDTDGTVF